MPVQMCNQVFNPVEEAAETECCTGEVQQVQTPQTITEEATNLINGDRSRDYGDPVECHERIATAVTAILGKEITARDVALFMMVVKTARQSNRAKHDNLVDYEAYSQICEKIDKCQTSP